MLGLIPTFLAVLAASDAPSHPTATLAKIRQAVASRDMAFDTISFRSESNGWRRSGNIISQLQEDVTIKGSQWRRIRTVHLHDGRAPGRDPDEFIIVLSPAKASVFEVIPRILKISTHDITPDSNSKLWSVAYDPFIELSGWWPTSSTHPASGTLAVAPPPWHLARILSLPTVQLLKSSEQIDATPCAVVSASEGTSDHIMWFDITNGLQLRRRRICDRQSQLSVQHDNEVFVELIPGVHVPTVQRRTEYVASSVYMKPRQDNMISNFNRSMSAIKTECSDECFRVDESLPGTLRLLYDQRRREIVPGGADEVLGQVSNTAAALYLQKRKDNLATYWTMGIALWNTACVTYLGSHFLFATRQRLFK